VSLITAAKTAQDPVSDTISVHGVHRKVRADLGFNRVGPASAGGCIRGLVRLVHDRWNCSKDFLFSVVPRLKSDFIDLQAFDSVYQVVYFSLGDC
jgi:hypothetical protein